MQEQRVADFRICPECGRTYAAADELCEADGHALLVPDDELIGDTIARHVLVRRIGRGGMGAVYLAVHEAIGSRIAVKVLHQAADEDSPEYARVLREAKAVNRIRHANIVQIHDMDRLVDGRPYIAMELLEGESLADRMWLGPAISVRHAGRWMAQVLSALGAAHAAGYVHRDLKPDNIYLQADGEVRLLDFGIAKLLGENATLTQDGAVVGTPTYLSPEQAKGTVDDVGPAADLYAVGGVLYELFTGSPPFPDRSVTQVLMAHVLEAPEPPSSLDGRIGPELDRLILDCLEKDPAARPESAESLAARLGPAIDEYLANHPDGDDPVLPDARYAGAGQVSRERARGDSQNRSGRRSRPALGTDDTVAADSHGGHTPRPSRSTPIARPTPPPAEKTADRRRRRPWLMPALAAVAAVALLGGAALFALAGEAPAEETEEAAAAAPSGVVAIALPGRPETLDPAVAAYADTARILGQVYEPLLRLDPVTLEPVAALATAWEETAPGEWRFALRDGVTFHDGRPLTGETAAAAMQGGPVRVGVMTSAAADGPGAVRVTTDLGRNVFVAQLSGLAASLALATDDEERPVGTGPFAVEGANFALGVVTLDAYGDYWGEPARVGQLVFRSTAEESLRLEQLEQGEIQLAAAILPETAARVRAEGQLVVSRTRETGVAYVGFNVRHPGLEDPRARRALTLAIDHRRLAERVYRGTPAAGLVPPALGGRPSNTARRHAVDEARRELADIGLAGETLSALFVSEESSWNPDPRLAAELLAEDLAAVGVTLEATFLPLDDIIGVMSEHALVMSAWLPDYPDATTFYFLCTRQWSDSGSVSFYWSEPFDAAYAAAQSEADPTRLAALHRTMDEIIAQDRPLVPIAFVAEHHAHAPELQGMQAGLASFFDLTAVSLESDD